MTITDAMRAAVPAPSYPCAIEACREVHTWPADDLHWYRDGFYCHLCLDEMEGDDAIGPPLDAVLCERQSDRYLGDT